MVQNAPNVFTGIHEESLADAVAIAMLQGISPIAWQTEKCRMHGMQRLVFEVHDWPDVRLGKALREVEKPRGDVCAAWKTATRACIISSALFVDHALYLGYDSAHQFITPLAERFFFCTLASSFVCKDTR